MSWTLDRRALCLGSLASLALPAGAIASAPPARPRVLVSSDIGGTDPDDFQSMVHLLLYADVLDLEGLVSSPWGEGTKRHILDVIDYYARDYANLRSWSAAYPAPDALRAMAKQGAQEAAGYAGFGAPSEGSDWIVRCARRDDPRPLHLLVWGGIDDLAQALHDAPDILPKLRVYFIGGPNKKWSADAYHYIAQHHPRLWMIEANATYRGWFTGGDQSGGWNNTTFVADRIAGRGAMGTYFATKLAGTIKMGDTPSLARLLHGVAGDPGAPGWGGRFVRAWDRAYTRFDRLTTQADRVEIFSIVELAIPLRAAGVAPEAVMTMENQKIPGHWQDGAMRFRCAPRDAKLFRYTIASNIAEIDGKGGAFTSHDPLPSVTAVPSRRWPNWWTDDPDPRLAEGPHAGAKTVSRWRHAFLTDFADRMARCAGPRGAAAG